ncbi:30S ribosomal protein S20 [Candidatus Azambacteria bacterium]|nr:30S ribosomal protein S20 [Candidatus Azambacteria bacterium]
MPIIKSEKKSLRQNKRRRERNLTYLNKMRFLLKTEKKLIDEGKTKEAKELLPKIYKAIDKAAKENIIKKNTAARRKSRITRSLSKASAK